MGLDVIIPVYKPDKKFDKLFAALLSQSVRPDNVILLNTETADNTCVQLARRLERITRKQRAYIRGKINVNIVSVLKEDFDHGGTRRMGVSRSDADYFVMMTQDAVPADDYLLERLLRAVKDEGCAIAYARQCEYG